MTMAWQFGANKAMKRPTAFNQSWSFGLDFLGWCAWPPLPHHDPAPRSMTCNLVPFPHRYPTCQPRALTQSR